MDIITAYNHWAAKYDRDENPTRDLDLRILQSKSQLFEEKLVIEAGCGTGKNSRWLAGCCRFLYAFDFSEAMLKKARERVKSRNVAFLRADMTKEWPFVNGSADRITINLVLEHIKNLEPVFACASQALRPNGLLFINELHPKKQAGGTKARFDNCGTTIRIESFYHSPEEYRLAAIQSGFSVKSIQDIWDPAPQKAPRLLSMTFEKG